MAEGGRRKRSAPKWQEEYDLAGAEASEGVAPRKRPPPSPAAPPSLAQRKPVLVNLSAAAAAPAATSTAARAASSGERQHTKEERLLLAKLHHVRAASHLRTAPPAAVRTGASGLSNEQRMRQAASLLKAEAVELESATSAQLKRPSKRPRPVASALPVES